MFKGDNFAQKKIQKYGEPSFIFAACFFIIVCISVFTANIPPVILGFYIVTSLLTFLVYAKDKSAAKRGAWRTPESTLHLLSLIGGWPGAVIAQQRLRHKSKKQSFRIVFWITVLLNCGAFIGLFTPEGKAVLHLLYRGFTR